MPGIAVVTAFLLVLVSIAVLVMYVHHIGQSLRVSALIELVGKDTRKLLDRKYPDKGPALEPTELASRSCAPAKSGVITGIGFEQLVEEARRAGCELELVPALGEFVPAGAPLFRVARRAGAGSTRIGCTSALILELEPTLDEDVAYGVRLLVDIAERSLADSPFQDPDHGRAGDRPAPRHPAAARAPTVPGRPPPRRGGRASGSPCRSMSWEAYVHLAFDEIRHGRSGLAPGLAPAEGRAHGPAVDRARPSASAILDDQLELLAAATETAMDDERDVEMALHEDREGIGAAASRR